jgi:hypothetical protein
MGVNRSRSIPCPYCSFMAATNADLKIHMARRHWDIEGLDILNNLPKTYKKEWKCSKCDTIFHDYSVGFCQCLLEPIESMSIVLRIFKIISTVIPVKQINFNVIYVRTIVKVFPN